VRIALTLGAVRHVSLAVLACCGMLVLGAAPATASESPVPEEVAAYFSADLIPRLADLYGPSADGESGIDFDEETTLIGDITRVMVWTEAFRAGEKTDRAVELSNTWVAAVSRVDGDAAESSDAEGEGAEVVAEQLGLATVWISPYTSAPELANFVPSDTLGDALSAAPEGSMLVYDEEYDAWFALNGDQLKPLAHGASAVSGAAMSLTDAQQSLWKQLETLPQTRTNQGFVVAGLTLAFVVLLLAVFVLVPDRRRSVLDPEVALGFSPRTSDRG